MQTRHQGGEYHGSSNCVDAACSCHRRCTGTKGNSSLRQGVSKVGQTCEGNLHFVLVLHTGATAAEAVKHAMAPVALPIRSDRAIFSIPVTAYLHWSSALRNNAKKCHGARRAGELPISIRKLSKHTHPGLGTDRVHGLLIFGHVLRRVGGMTKKKLTQYGQLISTSSFLYAIAIWAVTYTIW
jgi:hypothetical protein